MGLKITQKICSKFQREEGQLIKAISIIKKKIIFNGPFCQVLGVTLAFPEVYFLISMHKIMNIT